MARGAFEMVPVDATAPRVDSVAAPSVSPAKPPRKWVRWTNKLKQAFLDQLAASCDVSASARAIGVHPSSVHTLRRRDQDFAAEWQAALQLGYQMIETQLAGYVLSGGMLPDDAGGGRFDADQALRALAMHRQAVQGRGSTKRGGPRPRRATPEETDALLRKQLDALAKRLREEGA